MKPYERHEYSAHARLNADIAQQFVERLFKYIGLARYRICTANRCTILGLRVHDAQLKAELGISGFPEKDGLLIIMKGLTY